MQDAITSLKTFNKNNKERMSDLDSLLQLKEKNKDIKKSLLDYVNKGWMTMHGPKFMTAVDINKKIDDVNVDMKMNYTKF